MTQKQTKEKKQNNLISVTHIVVPKKIPEMNANKFQKTTRHTCLDLNPEWGTQLCSKSAHAPISYNRNEHLSAKSSSDYKAKTLTTKNVVESGRERSGKIKHHHDPKGHCLKKPIQMSSNYVCMKAANTKPSEKSTETAALSWLSEGERHKSHWWRSVWQWGCWISSCIVRPCFL